jgi:hypothetical protein
MLEKHDDREARKSLLGRREVPAVEVAEVA